MIWYSVALGAASGALAGLVATFLLGKKPEKKTAFVIVVVLLFTVFNALSREFILPEIRAHKTESDIQTAFTEVPAFQTIKKHEPDTYDRLVASLTEASREGYDQQQVIDTVRGEISLLIEKRLPKASDEAIVNHIGVVIDEMDELQRQGGDLCFKLLFPQAEGGINGTEVFSQELQKRDFEALDLTIRTFDENRRIPTEEEAMLVLEPIYLGLFEEYGNDVMALENPTASDVDRDELCSIAKTLYSNILKLDAAKSAGALRWMFTQP